ncbi:tyrosine-protein kinase JAK2-like [Anneissia japonica]|uniref:tyrosine-protein kinase JAK2-like n=1 Tax=Anneissia japonica TaxID=1529436 RepID=UPI0014257CAB|nr:tyrosine-protein kinase JAK2-like [Anneissia japonica]
MPKNFKDQPGRHWPFHGCCRRFKMGLYVRPKNQQEQEMASSNQDTVKVQLYGQKEKLQIPWHEKLTGEMVCKKAAAKCNIQCLSSTLFAICHRETKMWLSPKERIEKDSDLIFRFRFHVVTDAHALNSYEEQVLNYLYEQFHDDFIHGQIEDLSTEDRLGLIVISILQHNKGSHPLRMTSDSHFKSFVPKEWFRCLNKIDKHRLKMKVRGSLRKFTEESGDGSTCYRLMFLASLIDNKPMLIVEQYHVMQGERPCIVRISANKGIEIECQQNLAIKWRLMDLTDINIYKRLGDQDVWTVQLNRRNGCPEFLQLKTRQEAEGLVTLLDGYYRLLIDYYHFLCKELAPPSLDLLTKNRCHGPIPRTEAFDKLRKAGLDDGTYLIRQNPEKYDSYCLSVVYGQEFKNYKIKIEDGERVSLNEQNSFESLRSLMEFYRNQENCWCLDGPLKKCITSTSSSGTTTDNSLLITSRTGCPAPPSSPIPTRTSMNYIRESDLTDPSTWRPLGNGKFIEVKLGELNQLGIPVRRVNAVIKMPKEGAPSDFNMMFSQLADKLSGLKHAHIIRFEGISFNYRSIFEYADKGPLDKYLDSYKLHLKKPHLLHAATQIADALEFLEKKQIVHGSIAAHNVLVKHPPPRFHVKITDLMIGRYYFKLEDRHPIRMKRVRWTAPELLRGKHEPTMASDKFSYGVSLWQIIAYGRKPYAELSDEQVRGLYLNGRIPEVGDCPEELKEIVNRCLMFQPYNRPSFRDVLRDVRQVMLKVVGDYAGDRENNDVFVYDELFPSAFSNNSDSQPNQNSNGELVPVQSPDNNNTFAVAPTLNDSAQDPEWDPELDIMMDIDQEFHLRDIPNDNLQMQAKLGEGFYGEVHKAIWKLDGGFALDTEKVVAVKMLKEKHYEKYYEAFKREIQWMGSLDHRNIVKVLGVCKGRYIRLVLEFVPLGALKMYLKDKRNTVSTNTLYLFCTQICDAMHYLGNQEGMCIVHRDLAARNILVASEDHVKITDFGLAKSFGSDRDYYVVKGSVDMPYKWYAPECIFHLKFSREGDVWSFGVLMWEMFTYGMAPTYLDKNGKEVPSGRIVEFLEGGGRLHQRSTPDEAYEIMGRCWQTERRDRPSFADLSKTCKDLMSGDQPS